MASDFDSAGEPTPENSGSDLMGIIALAVTILSCGLLSPIGFILSVIGLIKPPRGFSITAMLISLVATALWALTIFFLIQVGTEAFKPFITMNLLSEAANTIENHRDADGKLPDDIEGNKLIIDVLDGWENAVRYEQAGDSFLIRSAGPDERMDTLDDIEVGSDGVLMFGTEQDAVEEFSDEPIKLEGQLDDQ